MIIWLNGTFGVGKTTVSKLLTQVMPDSRIFDSEEVGFLLQPLLKTMPVRDFQEWAPWRNLVVEVADQVLNYSGGTIVTPQTVLVEQYWDEIASGLAKVSIPAYHFVLHADRKTLIQRIDADTLPAKVRQWRLDHLDDYERALPWLDRKSRLIDTTKLSPNEVATVISDFIANGVSGSK